MVWEKSSSSIEHSFTPTVKLSAETLSGEWVETCERQRGSTWNKRVGKWTYLCTWRNFDTTCCSIHGALEMWSTDYTHLFHICNNISHLTTELIIIFLLMVIQNHCFCEGMCVCDGCGRSMRKRRTVDMYLYTCNTDRTGISLVMWHTGYGSYE